MKHEFTESTRLSSENIQPGMIISWDEDPNKPGIRQSQAPRSLGVVFMNKEELSVRILDDINQVINLKSLLKHDWCRPCLVGFDSPGRPNLAHPCHYHIHHEHYRHIELDRIQRYDGFMWASIVAALILLACDTIARS